MTTAPSKARVHTSQAPRVGGPYSQAIIANGLVFCAGQLAIDPATNNYVQGDIRAQTHRVLANLDAVLHAAGSDLHHVVQTTVFLIDLAHFADMNEVYAQYFGDTPPARSTVGVAALPGGRLIEIECIAVRPNYPGAIIVNQGIPAHSTFDLDEDREI